MFHVLFAASLVLAAADPTPTPGDKAPASAPAPPAAKPAQVCHEQPVLGTRLTRTVCANRAEIDHTISREQLRHFEPNPVR